MRLNLITKITLLINIVLIVAMVFFAYFNIKSLKQIFLEEAISDVDNISETLLRSTHYQMLEDDRPRVYQMMQEVETQRGIDHIRLINKDGTIIFSTEKEEIGTIVDKSAQGCNVCHAEDTPLVHASSMNRSRIFTSPQGGEKLLGMAKAIYNQESCYTAECHFHPPEAKMLGILDITVSLQSMQLQAATYRNNIIALTFILLLVLSASLIFLTQKMINRPVRQLVAHTRDLAEGRWSRIELDTRDELGELATAYNVMTTNLEQAQTELAVWASSLEAKVEERTREIKDMQSKLVRSEKVASLGELVAGIAHELNNPLTGVLMFSSMISSDPRLDPALKPDFDTIVRETQRCAEIVKGLLDFARESVPKKSMNSLNRIMDLTLSIVEHHSSFHDITLVRDYGEVPEILVDPNQIEQVYMNIVLNASQAMTTGSGQVTIRTYFQQEEGMVCTEIEDTGPGIPEETLEKIFDPFFSTKGHKGTGLGLSVSYGIIENHGGTIEVESETGRGTTFIIKLPADAPSGNDAETSSSEV